MAKDAIAKILAKNGPMLSSELAKILESQYNLAPTAARKRVERGCEDMRKLSHLIFPHRARFVYLRSDYGSPKFFSNLIDALQQTNSAYYSALQALKCALTSCCGLISLSPVERR